MLYKEDVKREILQNIKNKIETTSNENNLLLTFYIKVGKQDKANEFVETLSIKELDNK